MRLNQISLATSLVLLSSLAFADPSPKPKMNLNKAKCPKRTDECKGQKVDPCTSLI